MRNKVMKISAFLLVFVLCLSAPLTIWAASDKTESTQKEQVEEDADQVGTDTEQNGTDADRADLLASSGRPSAEMITNQYVLIKAASNSTYIWNMNGTGTGRNDCVHLDDNTGFNCTMQLRLEQTTSDGTKYYSIRYSDSDYYIDSERNDDKTNRVLHNGEKDRKQDNQLFRFVPVTDADGNVKKDTYYIMSKKGDNSNKDLYIGCEDNNGIEKGCKIATTDSSHKVEWLVQTAVPKEPATAVHLSGDNGSNAMVMMAPEGYKRGVTVQGDGGAKTEDIQLWLHGTSSKVELYWDDTYKAYKLRSRTLEERDTSILDIDYVWDIEDRSFSEGAQVHIWQEDSNNLAQYWRFLYAGDGYYYIQNAYTGMYLTNRDGDQDGSNVIMTATPTKWRVDVLNNTAQETLGTTWMSGISDDTLLSEINIPATHDTGTAQALLTESEGTSMVKCQQLYVNQQLNVGVRAFDIRCGMMYNGEPSIVHGNNIVGTCLDKGGDTLTLDAVFQKATDFLNAHPTETVIMVIKNDAGDDEEIAEAVDRYLLSGSYPIYQPAEEEVPTLGEVRGKIVLMRRYDFGHYQPKTPEIMFGPYLEQWDTVDYSVFSQNKNAIKLYESYNNGQSCLSVWVQDAYKENPETKKGYVSGTWEQASGSTIGSTGYVFNYTSGTGGEVIPLNYARTMNDWLMSLKCRKAQDGKRLGIFMMNFVDGNLAEMVYKNNDFIEDDVFLGDISLTYGQSLGESNYKDFEKTAGGLLEFEDPSIVPGIEDSGKTQYTMIFTPYDVTQAAQKKSVTVTVNKKTITMKYPYKGTITFGAPCPVDFVGFAPGVVYTSELVGDDDPDEEIHIESKMTNEYGESFDPDSLTADTIMQAGTYEMFITNADTASEKYYPKPHGQISGSKDVAFSVLQREIEWKWSGNKYVYHVGDPMNITAEITNQVEGWPCYVTKYNSSGTGTSSYDEKTGMWSIYDVAFSHLSDERNYKMPKIRETATYYIVKDDDDPPFYPNLIHIEKGKKLKNASLGNSKFKGGHLEFAKDDQEKVLQPEDTGDYTVYLVMDETGHSIPLGTTRVNVVDEGQGTASGSGSGKTVKSARTGNDTRMSALLALAGASGACICAALCRKRRHYI